MKVLRLLDEIGNYSNKLVRTDDLNFSVTTFKILTHIKQVSGILLKPATLKPGLRQSLPFFLCTKCKETDGGTKIGIGKCVSNLWRSPWPPFSNESFYIFNTKLHAKSAKWNIEMFKSICAIADLTTV